ncbi:dihydropteroate synthase [Geobacter metallireducens RCH3]|uniref:Dihydropteroate synthase n=1 Tax=Geobacter metallireducens (strain ATCC 53774 / DSM 7210 / GS-15) TaxID=269799 RepID=Q39UF6_GEOMG|nr:dihydropteroate synthase [Geobacter metallireducens]ABB32118.1 dihydropteroate synthase [Geobacter metallireducens GS-15]EHP88693.1 dihydropteroate synthase [Geobacter metallireducens RCH3]
MGKSDEIVVPSFWRLAKRSLDLSRRPCIMGILNVTPDSFSDGSRYLDLDRAEERAHQMVEQGADIVDIGGESTRPNIAPVDADEELRRVIPLVERLAGRIPVPISVDTYKAVVAREALRVGAEIVNDISGLTFDPAMAATVAEADAGLVVMHTRGRPDTMQRDTAYGNLIAEVIDFLRQSVLIAEAAGVSKERIVVDPGIGFAKSVQGNLEILRQLRDVASLQLPILVGTSRKSFIGTILGRNVDERLFGTAATVALAVANGASIIRVHEVREMRDVADMAHAVLHPHAY